MKTEIERDAHFQAAQAEMRLAKHGIEKAANMAMQAAEVLMASAVEREHRLIAALAHLFHEMEMSDLAEAKRWLAEAKKTLAGEAA